MSAGTTHARLVDEFVAAMRQHGVAVDRQTVAQEVDERIADIAERLRTDPETVLRDHARDDWGRQMSAAVLDQIRGERLLDPGAPAAMSTPHSTE